MSETNATTDAVASDTQDTVVAKQVHDEVMQDLLRQKAKSRELEEKLQSLEGERENLKVKSLKDKEQWQKLAELKEREADDFKKQLESQKTTTTNYFKRSEIRQQAMKLGIRENALDDLDLLGYDDVQLETTSTGKINVLGADKFVERLKTTKPHWFNDRTAPNIDSASPGVTRPSSVSVQDVLRLQKEGKKAEYEAALLKLRQQK